MVDLSRYEGFEWDEGNIDKSYKKHGISPNESEEIFLDEKLKIIQDIYHSRQEKRMIALGSTFEGNKLFIVFTARGERIRIISARPMDKKEISTYEKS